LNFWGGEEYWYSLAIGRLVDFKTSREGSEYRNSSVTGRKVQMNFQGGERSTGRSVELKLPGRGKSTCTLQQMEESLS
jgi:hypothetical protein